MGTTQDSSPLSPRIELNSVVKSYLGQPVLNKLSFRLEGARTLLLLGANGSGKSTLLRILAGLIVPDSGTVFVGHSATRRSYYGHEPQLYLGLSVLENLRFFAALLAADMCGDRLCQSNSNGGSRFEVDAFIEHWGLATIRHKRIHELSRGMRARVGLCRSFLGAPDVLLLDEPTSNLDQNASELVVKEIDAAQKRGATIVVASHDVTRLCGIAQEAIVLAHQNIACHERLGPGGASIQAVSLYHKVNA